MKIIRKEITIKAPVEKVWKHLTEPQKIATWFLPTDFEPKVGRALLCAVRIRERSNAKP